MNPLNLVRVHPPREMCGGNPVMTQINWSACGNREVEFAREFAEAVLIACGRADELNQEFLEKRLDKLDDL